MNQTGTSKQQILERMRQVGLRLTKQRVAMANLISLWQRPFTSADLIVDLRRSGMGVHRATVFRDLNTLVEKGILKEVRATGLSGRHFVLAHDRSGHFLVCERCGSVVEATEGEMMMVLKQWTEMAPAAKGWKVRAHEVESYGLCPGCESKKIE
jgi:Fe2+ or Zn2+ uptake regulation protein